ncbi:MAG: hypothetical protein ACKO5J_03365 [Rubrivivax sp.]
MSLQTMGLNAYLEEIDLHSRSHAVARTSGALLALAALAALLAGCASQPAAPPTVSPVVNAPVQLAWQQGRTPEQASSTLAPLAGKLTVTPPDQIPLDRLKVPPGFRLELWAHGLPGGRAMARADNGKIYVGTRGIGRVY